MDVLIITYTESNKITVYQNVNKWKPSKINSNATGWNAEDRQTVNGTIACSPFPSIMQQY
jgi:hypothetical protein